MQDFTGKVAVVTGAASGIGLELARKAATLGMRLVLADVEARALAAAGDELGRAFGADPLVVAVDVSDAAQVDRLAAAALERFGAVHLLCNNAGVGLGGFIWESTEPDWRWVLGVNLMGVVHGLRSFVPLMLRQDAPAHIVNTASVAGLVSAPMLGVYGASKHAVVCLTETLCHELRMVGARIGVTLLCPAYVNTGIAEADRNRPEALLNATGPTASQQAAGQAIARAAEAGRLSAAEIAAATFEAIQEARFYALPHPEALVMVRARLEDILGGRSPTDPSAARRQQAASSHPE